MTTATDCTRCNGWGDIVTARDHAGRGHLLGWGR